MSRILIRTGKHGSIYTKEVSIGRPPLNGCMCQDGSCESCNRVVEAWEAMRGALGTFPTLMSKTDRSYSFYYSKVVSWHNTTRRAALALADKVSRVTPTCDAQDHLTEAEYQACRICHSTDEAAKGKP